MSSKAAEELFNKTLKCLHARSLPYEPPIYPPHAAWGKIRNMGLVKRAWQKTAVAPGVIDLYVHIPFCKTLCSFCGLYTKILSSPAALNRYLDALSIEAQALGAMIHPRKINGVRIGGGTPSLLSPAQIRRLFGIIFKSFTPERDRFGSSPCGIVFEANPEFLTVQKLQALKDEGVNWIAMGVQSLDNKVLRLANRVQTAAGVERVYKNARRIGNFCIAFDLMYGLDGQTGESFINDIKTLVGWNPDRIVMYEFCPTARTPFSQGGKIVTQEKRREVAAMVQTGLAVLKSSGYRVNNEINEYWGVRGGPCDKIYTYTYDEHDSHGNWHSVLALGAGVMSVANMHLRYQNIDKVEDYEAKLQQGDLPIDTGVALVPRLNMINHMILNLINSGRVSSKQFKKEFNASMEKRFGPKLRNLVSRGVLRRCDGDYRVNTARKRVIFEVPRAFFEDSIIKRLQSRFSLARKGEAPKRKQAVILTGDRNISVRGMVAEMMRARGEGGDSLKLVADSAEEARLRPLIKAARKLKFRHIVVKTTGSR